jgi:ATP-dependent DNA ligase
MRRFTALYEALDRTTSTNAKVAALSAYFREAPPGDAAWALFFLTGRRLKRLLPSAVLHEIAREDTGLPDWILSESYAAVGDFAETLALLLDAGGGGGALRSLESWIRELVLPLRDAAALQQKAALRAFWSELSPAERLVLNKLVTGEMRVGVSATLVIRAVAEVAGVTPPVMAHRLMGEWEPSGAFFLSLQAPEGRADDDSRPYPFYLASPLEDPVESLGPREDWIAEWKWDGIRAQLVRRQEVHLWSRGEELITGRFPELRDAGRLLPVGTVLDGEVLAFRDGTVRPFSILQTRIGRQKLTPKILADAPAVLMTYDLLEDAGHDLRERPLHVRRARLQALLAQTAGPLMLSPSVEGGGWSDLARQREESRARHVEGLMLKHRASPYRSGRPRGEWWKWKIAPYTLDTVMIYAHPGHGRRASLFTDYTFAVWHEGALVPIARAYSGLSDAEILELDGWIRRHIRDRFGPVRAVEPVQVFELAFENIARSARHRSGIAVRFPRILRWRKDKKPEDADRLESLIALVKPT